MTQIIECGRTLAGAFVAFSIRWEGDLPSAGTVSWSMVVTSGDGSDELRLGYERAGGSFSEQYVHDRRSGRRQSVEDDADLGDDEITVRFPASVVGVAVEWPVWRAVIAVDGAEVTEQVASMS